MAHTSTSNLPAWEERIRKALDQWRKGGMENHFAGTLMAQEVLRAGAAAPRAVANRVLEAGLAALRVSHPGDVDLLEGHFLQGQTMESLAERMGFAESSIYPKQKKALQRLAATLAGREDALIAERRARFDQRSNAAKRVELVGVESHVANLRPILTQRGPPWIISIEGIGGIGKTTLADALVRSLTTTVEFDDFAWVSAQPAILDLGGGVRQLERPALTAASLINALVQQLAPEAAGALFAAEETALAFLRNRLKEAPHLVVIDNLETVIDLEALLPTLHDLAEPSKFLLTSRRRLPGERGVFSFPAPELSEAQAFRLARQEAQVRNLPALAAATDMELRPIYQVVGGHPLALLLVVGQLHIHPLDVVLRQLTSAVGAPVESLYTYIYRYAWESLDETSQCVLLSMPLVKIDGEDLAYIAAVSHVAPDDAAEALRRLVTLNLVMTVGGLHQKRYTIHNLTRTFLQEQVARWSGK